jgi:hypothetical protein
MAPLVGRSPWPPPLRRVLGRHGEGAGVRRRWKMDPVQGGVGAAGGASPCGLDDVRMAAANQGRVEL